MSSGISSGTFTTPILFNQYTMAWFVTDETKVLSVDGDILHGKKEIVDGYCKLPPSLNLIPTHGPCKFKFYTNNSVFSSESVYKIVRF